MPLDDENAYWRQYYGVGRPWPATPRNRTGCLVLLVGALAVIVVTLVAALVVALV